MARSIKFELISEQVFTIRQLRRLYNIAAYYSENVDWNLDKFWVGPGKVKPNMGKFQDNELAKNTVQYFLAEGMNSDKHFIDVMSDGVEKGIMISEESLNTKTYSGSVRIAGNESLARIVVKALSEISLVFPNTQIKVKDDGHFLFTDLIIQKGRAIPDTSWVPGFMRDLIDLSVSTKETQFNIKDTSTIKYYKPDKQARLDGLKYIVKKMSQLLDTETIRFKEIKDLPFEQWPEVEFFMRNVKLSDFNNYILDEGKLLSGYFGEHWNLIDVDVEAESFRLLAEMQKELGKYDDIYSIKVF